MTKNDNQYGVWTGYFAGHYKYDRLKTAAKLYTDFFKANVYLTDDNPVLDAWVATPEAQKMLTALVIDVQNHVLSVAEFALPAHDIRQILFKDPAEALRFYQIEKLQGFKSTFPIPTNFHDIGRLLEGRFFHPDNPHDNWIPHSQLSFLLLKAILDKPDYQAMPQALKNHFLYAVASHSGDNGQTFMSRAVQTCDRMQLIGSEGLFRALSYVVCLMDGHIKYPVWQDYKNDLPDMKDHTSVLSLLEYFARNMRENIGDNHEKWQRRVAIENVAILMMACHDNPSLYQKIFAPELNPSAYYGQRKQKIPDDIMQAAKDLYILHSGTYPMLSSQFDTTRKIFDLLQSPKGSAQLTNSMKIQMTRAMGILMANERHSLYQTLCFAEALRNEQDECDRQVIISMEQDAPDFIKQMAKAAHAYCPQSQSHFLNRASENLPANSLR